MKTYFELLGGSPKIGRELSPHSTSAHRMGARALIGLGLWLSAAAAGVAAGPSEPVGGALAKVASEKLLARIRVHSSSDQHEAPWHPESLRFSRDMRHIAYAEHWD